MLFNKLTILLPFLLTVAATPVIHIDELPVNQAQLSATTCQSSGANIAPITIREDGRQFTFTIQRELGQGEEGVVYEVTSGVNTYAAKFLPTGTAASAAQEVQNLKTVGQYVASGTGANPDPAGRDGYWIVMVFVLGGPVHSFPPFLVQLGLSQQACMNYVRQTLWPPLAQAVSQYTAKGLLHQDLTDRNVFVRLDPAGRVVADLIDWADAAPIQPTSSDTILNWFRTNQYPGKKQHNGAATDWEEAALPILCTPDPTVSTE